MLRPVTNDPSDNLCFAASEWLNTVANALSHEGLELLHRGLMSPDLEVSIRIQLRAGALVLEVSDGLRRTDIACVDVAPAQPDDGMGSITSRAVH